MMTTAASATSRRLRCLLAGAWRRSPLAAALNRRRQWPPQGLRCYPLDFHLTAIVTVPRLPSFPVCPPIRGAAGLTASDGRAGWNGETNFRI